MKLVLDEDFTELKTVSQDARGRVAIGKAGSSRIYSVSQNRHGQILLTPMVQVPEHETWLWNHPDALSSVKRGLQDDAAGRVSDLGSFAEFADMVIED